MRIFIFLLLFLTSCASFGELHNCNEQARIEVISTEDDQVIAILKKEDYRLKVLVKNITAKDVELNKSYTISYKRVEGGEVSGVDEVINVCEYELIVNVQ